MLPAQQQIYDRAERRKKLLEQLLGQSVQPEQTQYAGRLAVPYSPWQGLTKIAQALIARKGLDRLDKQQQDVTQEFSQGREQAVGRFMEQMQGKPQTGGPLRGVQDYQQFSPAVKPDLPGAAMTAATDPHLQGGNNQVLSALLRSKMGGQSSRSRPIPTSSGYYEETPKGWQPMMGSDNQPLLPVPADARTQRAVAQAKTEGAGRGDKNVQQPQREVAIDASEQKTELLDDLIDTAKGQSGVFTTGFIGQVSKGLGGTPAHDLFNTLNTIKANIGFDRLQEMRDSSKTGGALGQVSEMENKLLQQVWSSLEQSQGQEQFKENLERVRDQVKASWQRINDAYKKDYGVDYKPGIERGPEPAKRSLEDLLKQYGQP